MGHFDGAVGQVFFPGLAAGGGIDGNELLGEGEAHHEVGGAEVALDEDVVAGGGLLGQPGLDRLQIPGQGREVGGNLAPEFLKLGGQEGDPADLELLPGPGLLVWSDAVVEDKEQALGHVGLPLPGHCLISLQ